MIEIDRKCEYTAHGYKFRNFTTLNQQELLEILSWRNDDSVRKWMYSDTKIEEEEHFQYVISLDNRDDAYYWVVYDAENETVGVVNVTHINRESNQGELGYYAVPGSYGDGFSFVKECFYFYFCVLRFEKFYGAVDVDNVAAYWLDKFLGCDFTSIQNIHTASGTKRYYVCDNLSPQTFLSNYKKSIVEYIKFVKNENRKLR